MALHFVLPAALETLYIELIWCLFGDIKVSGISYFKDKCSRKIMLADEVFDIIMDVLETSGFILSLLLGEVFPSWSNIDLPAHERVLHLWILSSLYLFVDCNVERKNLPVQESLLFFIHGIVPILSSAHNLYLCDKTLMIQWDEKKRLVTLPGKVWCSSSTKDKGIPSGRALWLYDGFLLLFSAVDLCQAVVDSFFLLIERREKIAIVLAEDSQKLGRSRV